MTKSPSTQAVLKIEGLSKSFGGIQAVDNVSFSVAVGEMLALIGPNGAGKSTCFNMLMGQLKPSTGKITFAGENIVGMTPRQIWRLGVGRTFQITATYPSMTVIENVQMALISDRQRIFSSIRVASRLYRDEAMALLELVGMSAQAARHAAVLAYGDVKRLELAIALANSPRLLLMDEPTAGMGPKERIDLMQLTADIVAEREISALFTEHDMDVVFTHAHRVMVLNRGALIANGTVDEVRDNPQVQEIYLGGGTLYASDHA
ncbi:MAG: ABC transporter ATP-binding protein [Burkholderiaceae bacterium]